ncbi:tRNA (adenosine(37)-N6)-threonylcarbamoyltransferase complex dimerization subunit type 1 TsaB [Larsenimonas salina]|uniref:tRNA (adenosine(37)-N6)-threonylcarbamoyltransferase complex dimerization subunit type 1 TsaB n=1 Tax=Larsenimonas salina TaxID=1295565 RepID=UPI00207347D1|nr:tRNA (adenosine(37)-N6)-threonylcarbamoyltransferase complex dimerization subunit type 1 TsaB [Larsenimonas salina]MCM5703955.1 tRNA (adenosine(37)-N6)-threonylcarbamoyltransferase complex dimerization subunit type 1 TsaB [Larsenimonas salina]
MSTLLALDASSSACSVALWHRGTILGEHVIAPREHTQRLMPMVDRLMSEAGLSLSQLDALAYGRGPGSFTGIRIAAGTVQGLAYGLDRPIVPVSTLETLALGAARQHGVTHVVPAFDARMNELYVAAFEVNVKTYQLRCCLEERVCAPQALEAAMFEGARWFGAGSGWTLRDRLSLEVAQCVIDDNNTLEPDARDMVCLAQKGLDAGNAVAPHEATPIYLRDQVASRRH